MSIEDNGVLGIALGSSEAGGYVNLDGAITGWAFTNESVPAERTVTRIARAVSTPIPHVSQAGQWTFTPAGFPIAILTGKAAADRVIKALKRRRGFGSTCFFQGPSARIASMSFARMRIFPCSAIYCSAESALTAKRPFRFAIR
jgi:hypothetical protein